MNDNFETSVQVQYTKMFNAGPLLPRKQGQKQRVYNIIILVWLIWIVQWDGG